MANEFIARKGLIALDNSQITGSLNISGSLSVNNTPAMLGSGTTNYLAKFTAGGTVGDSGIYESGGNVGIGTSSPTSKLMVLGGGAVPIRWGNTSSLGALTYSGSDPIIQSNTGNLLFYYGATEGMRLNSGGNLLINTTNDTGLYKLDVNGTGRFSGNLVTSAGFAINANNGTLLIAPSSTRGIINLGGTTDNFLTFSDKGYIGQGSNYFQILARAGAALTLGSNNANVLVFTLDTGAATFSSSVTTVGSIQTQDSSVLNLGYNQGGGATLKYNANGNLDITPRPGYSTVFTAGNVGIETNGPGAKLHIRGSHSGLTGWGTEILRLQSDTDFSGMSFQGSSGNFYGAIRAGGNQINGLQFLSLNNDGSPSTVVMAYNKLGNVLIGTPTDNGTKLNVNGTTFTDTLTQNPTLHGTKVIRSTSTATSITIDLATEFPLLSMTSNVIGVFGKLTGNYLGNGGVREFYIVRNTNGTWSTAQYSAITGQSIATVTGSGTTIILTTNGNRTFTLELTVKIS